MSDEYSDKNAAELTQILLLGSLRRKDEKQNALATEIFVKLGDVHLSLLVDEAICKKHSMSYRLRLLHVIDRIGPGIDAVCHMKLAMIVFGPNQKISHAVKTLLARPRGKFDERMGPDRTGPITPTAGISMGYEGKNAAELAPLLFVDALRKKDMKQNALATELIVRSGDKALPFLVAEASYRHPTNFRLRLLRVIDRIGPTKDPVAFMNLGILTRNPNEKIRQAAESILLRPRGGPDLREESARPDWVIPTPATSMN